MVPTDPTANDLVDRRDYLRIAGGLAAGATAGLAGCAESVPGGSDGGSDDPTGDGSDATATGLLSTAVSDQPGDIGDFESCIVTLNGVWLGPRAGEEGSDGGGEGGSGEDEDGQGDDGGSGGGDDANETEQDDGSGPPADAGQGGNSSSEDAASGSQDGNETDANQTDADADDSAEEDDAEEADGEGGDGEEEEEESADSGDDADGEGEEDSGGRRYLEFAEPQEADLTQLQGDAQQLVGEHEVETGTYQFLQLDVAGVRGTLTDGSEADVTTPGNAPLKFNESFDVREGYRTTFLADFTPVKRGNGSYIFQPVASETEVNYEEIQSSGDGSGDAGGDESSTDGGGNATDADGTTTGGNESTAGGNETSA